MVTGRQHWSQSHTVRSFKSKTENRNRQTKGNQPKKESESNTATKKKKGKPNQGGRVGEHNSLPLLRLRFSPAVCPCLGIDPLAYRSYPLSASLRFVSKLPPLWRVTCTQGIQSMVWNPGIASVGEKTKRGNIK